MWVHSRMTRRKKVFGCCFSVIFVVAVWRLYYYVVCGIDALPHNGYSKRRPKHHSIHVYKNIAIAAGKAAAAAAGEVNSISGMVWSGRGQFVTGGEMLFWLLSLNLNGCAIDTKPYFSCAQIGWCFRITDLFDRIPLKFKISYM